MPGAHHGFAIREARSRYGTCYHIRPATVTISSTPILPATSNLLGFPSIMSHKNGSLRVPLLFDPGTGWEYGIGIDLAGKVVARPWKPILASTFSSRSACA